MSLEVMYERCAGIDVHQRFLVVCLILVEGGKRRKEIRTFRNETADLLALRAWLLQEGCSHVGMESTGVYTPVDSMATCVTFRALSHWRRRNTSGVMVLKLSRSL